MPSKAVDWALVGVGGFLLLLCFEVIRAPLLHWLDIVFIAAPFGAVGGVLVFLGLHRRKNRKRSMMRLQTPD